MNKLNITLFALALFACVLAISAEPELENEIEEGDAEVDESADGITFGNFGVSSDDKKKEKRGYWSQPVEEQWGDDIIQHGIQDTVNGRHQSCGTAKSEANCRVCCAESGKAHRYATDLKWRTVKHLKMSRCICVSTAPGVTPV